MIALRLVRLIESHSEKLSDDLVQKILHDERTREFLRVPAGELHERCHEIYRHLSDWLISKTERDVATVYGRVGGRRAEQSVPLPALIWALILTKEHLWDFLEREEIRSSIDLFGELELLRSLDQFFDRAIYHAAQGYQHARMAAAV